MDLFKLKNMNPDINFYSLDDPAFKKYGAVHINLDIGPIVSYLKQHANAAEKTSYYETSVEELESVKSFYEYVKNKIYGGMDIQIGWVYGWNTKMNGMEFHKGSEVIAAATDMAVILGQYKDIEYIGNNKPVYDSSKVEIFLVPEGTVLELFAGTLHLSPVQTEREEQFKAAIVLLKGTNEALTFNPKENGERSMLAGVNKWVLMHPEVDDTSGGIISGKNIEILL